MARRQEPPRDESFDRRHQRNCKLFQPLPQALTMASLSDVTSTMGEYMLKGWVSFGKNTSSAIDR